MTARSAACAFCFLLVLLALTGCRQRDPLCGSVSCGEADGGAGGAGADAGAGGDAGTAGDAGAASDAGDGAGGVDAGGGAGESATGAVGSSGAGGDEPRATAGGSAGEHNEAGAGGVAASDDCGGCAKGLSCIAHDPATPSCEYANPGRWLVFQGNDTGELPLGLRALRLEGPNHTPSISLNQGIPGDYFDVDSWSPDGRHLLVYGLSFSNPETNRLLHVQFGNGLPVVQAALPGMPLVGTDMFSLAWAPDSSRVLIKNSTATPETYLARFTSAGVTSELLFQDEEPLQLSFCTNPRWFIRKIAGAGGVNETRLVDSENPSAETALWPGTTYPSPDGHFLIGSDSGTGTFGATCGADPQVVHLSDRAASEFSTSLWSADSRFFAVFQDDGQYDGIEVLDAVNGFGAVFSAYTANEDYGWAPEGSHLVVLGATEPGAECEILDVDLTTAPPQLRRRGRCPAVGPFEGSWGLLKNGAIWATQMAPKEPPSLWLLEPEADTWRQVASWDGYSPNFTPDENFVVIYGDAGVSAFPLKGPLAEIPLQPAVLPDSYVDAFYAGGVIVGHYEYGSEVTTGQLWWAPLGSTSFGPPVPLSDVSYAGVPDLQPEP
jgi:hypothetical protein